MKRLVKIYGTTIGVLIGILLAGCYMAAMKALCIYLGEL